MVRIVADTTSGISAVDARKLGIAFLPQIIIFGDKEYRDDNEIDNVTFLKKLITSPTLPKTSAPAPVLYLPIFREACNKGETVIIVCPSAEVSGTVRSATDAAVGFRKEECPQADIRVIDTKTIGAGLATMVMQAKKWADEGLDPDTIVSRISDLAKRSRSYFVANTLEYLQKGGRIGGAQALVGGLLQIKPILTLKNGRAELEENQRTKKRALGRLIELVTTQYPKNEDGYLSIMHGGNVEEARTLARKLAEKLDLDEQNIPIYFLPPAILTHAGPGVLALSFLLAS